MNENLNVYFWGLNDDIIANIVNAIRESKLGENDGNILKKVNYISEIEINSGIKQVLFLMPEIEINNISGIEFAGLARKYHKRIIIFFISRNNLSLVSIMKKFIFPAGYFLTDEISDAVILLEKILNNEKCVTEENEQIMEIISQYERITIPLLNVIYFVACNKKIVCKLNDGRNVEFYGTLANIEEKHGNVFLRSHAGYLVNKEEILMINYTKNFITVSNNETIPISRKYRKEIKQYLDFKHKRTGVLI